MAEVGELVRELRHLTSLNEPRYGGPYEGVAAEACVEAMGNAADALSALLSECQSSMATIAEERARAEAAEARCDELREALRPRSMDTAPKDGTRVLLALDGNAFVIGAWSAAIKNRRQSGWRLNPTDVHTVFPLAWMPLPALTETIRGKTGAGAHSCTSPLPVVYPRQALFTGRG